ncbi:MAG TPA: nitroreductase family protein [Pirellulaceae bacterium]|nr:nitroreductase family protein [Pirellulaceae bacterium]HMO91626.1 nitroreductase family protein [Pirellulaceae bacterium]HMP68323.1 nitroreductase family protein [Pirellulaceae bacterium]
MSTFEFEPFQGLPQLSDSQQLQRAQSFYEQLKQRRTIRHFSDKMIPEEVIDWCLMSAGTAPNGANLQPWHFALVKSTAIKREIRLAAEQEEKEFYNGRAPQAWLDALAPLGTDEHKPFLEIAPYLIVIFAKTISLMEDGRQIKNYYVNESVGIATGMLISALHACGIATLTHTPSPMKFLNEILGRPGHERPFLILVVGYPAENATVPRIVKKTLDEIRTIH